MSQGLQSLHKYADTASGACTSQSDESHHLSDYLPKRRPSNLSQGTGVQALLHSYCCLDFASILDVTQLRLYRLRKLMKDCVQNRQAPPSLSHVWLPPQSWLVPTMSCHLYPVSTALLSCMPWHEADLPARA